MKPLRRPVRGLLSTLAVLSMMGTGVVMSAPAASAALDPNLPAPGKAFQANAVSIGIDAYVYDATGSDMDGVASGRAYSSTYQSTPDDGRSTAYANNISSANHPFPENVYSFESTSGGPVTGSGDAGSSTDGAVTLGASQTSADANLASGADTCPATGLVLAKSTVVTRDVHNPVADWYGPGGAGVVDQVGEATQSVETRTESNGRTDVDARGLVGEAQGPGGTYVVGNGAATVTVLTPMKIVAHADGLNPSTVDYTEPVLQVTDANGVSYPVASVSGSSATVHDPKDPTLVTDIFMETPRQSTTADGTSANAGGVTFRTLTYQVDPTNGSYVRTIGSAAVGQASLYLSLPAGGLDCTALADTDNDGLLDKDEATEGTDPTVADTDGDGLSDGQEVNTYYTDPTSADTDSDGLHDGDEVNTYTTDPMTYDTDGDGLSDGDEAHTYNTDPVTADTDGDSLEDGDEVSSYNTDPLKADTDGDGLSDGDELYTYTTNPAAADTDLDGLNDGDEVNTYDSDPLTADSDSDGLSDGVEVSTSHTEPLVPDTDQDGLSDGAEVNNYKTDPLVADTDVDGLDDAVEVNYYKTDPLVADTDKGGVSDGAEVADGTDPLNGTDDKPVVVKPTTDSDGDGVPDVVETRLGTNPYKADTDNDGLTDRQEITGAANWKYHHRATSPVRADSDRDGLTDGQEVHGMKVRRFKHVHTNPNRADTDHDHLKDGREVHGFFNKKFHKVFKSNPVRRDSDHDGLRDRVEVTGSANRKFHRQPTNPLRKNTDHSSLTDRKEIRAGSNPARAKSTPCHP